MIWTRRENCFTLQTIHDPEKERREREGKRHDKEK